MQERERVAGGPVFGGARVYGMMARADSWLVQLGAYAVRVGRSVPGSSPGRGGGSLFQSSSALQDTGVLRKAPFPGWRGDSPTNSLPALVSGPVQGAGGGRRQLHLCPWKRHCPRRTTQWPAGSMKTIQRRPPG